MARWTLGERVAERRRRLFVGRSAELELFRAALHAPDPPFSVLFLHGPGGIGKSALLDRLGEHVSAVGGWPVRVDGGALASAPEVFPGLVRRMRRARSAGSAEDPAAGRTVLIVDGFDRAGEWGERIREELVAALPGDGIAVVAARVAPEGGWWDAAWRERLRSVGIRGLDGPESRELLRRSGVGDAAVDDLVRVAHGHPLALCLLAEVARRSGDTGVPTAGLLEADLVSMLLRRLVDTVPDVGRRRALEVCALAWATTEPLLRAALEVEDAHDLFDWLRGLSFVDAGPDGLRPHDLARDVLDLDLRWRDPDGYRRVFRRVRRYVHRSFEAPDPLRRRRAFAEVKFIFRNLPGVLSPVDWGSWGLHHPEPASGADHDEILRLVTAAEGARSAEIARRWLALQPEGFLVLRERGGARRGFLGLLNLSDATAEDVAADPVAATAWRHATRSAPVRQGEIVTQTRFVIDRDRYQEPSPTLNAIPVVTLQRYLTMRSLAFDFLTLAEPDRWDDYFALAGLPRVAGADVVVDGRRFGLFCHDFRAVPAAAMIESWEDRVLAQDFGRPELGPPTAAVPSKAEFAAEVRQALRDLRRRDLLSRSGLLRTRLLAEWSAPERPDGESLGRVLHDATEALRADPRDDKLWQAVRRTYLDPMRTQESAAAALGLPFSTYRRHLTAGVARIVDWCWEREIHGWPPVSRTEQK